VLEELSSATFVTLRSAGGAMIGLQDKTAARLPPTLEEASGSVELSFEVDDVDNTWKRWKEAGIELVTDPMDLPFGRYFMAKDPEGHYLSAYRFTRQPATPPEKPRTGS
ncbi:MAG: VOC family protein, partial [Chloroflexota bacterium]|nr:VOC family protein [Chloroflexota bacterium]